MQDPLSSTAPSFGTSSGTAIWQNEWIDTLWGQLTSGTFSGIDNVVVDSDLAEGESRLQADLDALDQMLAGSAKQSVADIQSYALSNRFNPGLDPLTGSLPVTKSLANVLQYAYQQGLPDLVAEVSGSSFSATSAPGEAGQLSVTVRNQGGLKTQTPITLKVFASQQPVLDNQAIEIGEHSWSQLKLKPNKREQANVSVRLPETLASGTYNIFVVVDTSSNLRESNKANNISVAAQSQIVVAASSAPPLVTPTALTASKATPPASQSLSNTAASHDCHLPFTVVAEGRVSINGSSDFDGDPLLPGDDALIYGGRGLTLNGQPTLPVQRDANGNPILDSQGRPLLVENAIAVSNNYSVFNAPNNQYGGLFPPPIVDTQTVTVPAHNALVDATLAKQIPEGSSLIVFNPRSQRLNNSQDWASNFPPGGTASNPSVIRITGGGLTIPNRVTLENTILLVDSGDINFNGSGHQLNNVTLVTYNGGINLSNVVATDLTAIASRQLNMNGGARFGGQSLLASQNSVTFNGATTSGADKLKVISQSDITFNGNSDTRAQFLAAGNFNFNGNSTLYGRIKVKGDITFNGSATVVAANDAPIVGGNKTIVVTEDSGATALGIGLPVDPDDDLLSLRVSEVPDLLKGSVLLANGNAVAVGQTLSLSDLQSLTFVPTADANGAAGRFSYTADDGWCQPSSQTIELQITPVNDGPVIVAPSALSLAEDTTLSFLSGLQIQDVDSGELSLQATLSVSQGELRLGEATSGQRSLVLTGSLSELNASLAQLHYQPDSDYTGADALTITVNDQGNTGAGGALSDSVTVDLTITPVNDAPILTGPTLVTLPEDASQPIVGLQVSDIDAGDLEISVRLSVGEGTLRLTQQDGITVQSGSVNGASEWIFQGTVSAINSALSSLSYQGAADYAGADTLLFEVNDLGNTGAGGPLSALHTVALEITPVNDAPVLSGPALVTVVEDSLQAITGLQVSDVDAGAGELSVRLSVEQGTLQLSQVEGLNIQVGDVVGSGELVFQGTLSAINAALSSLSYQGGANYAGADALRFEVSDLGNTGAGGPLSQTHTVGLQVTPVNDGPVISAPIALSLPEDTPLSFLSSLQIQDIDAGELPLQVALSVGQGTLHFSNAASAGQNTLLLTGSLSELNAQLGYLQYRPSADYVGTDALVMTVSDLGNTGAGGPLTGSATVELTITPVNDAPILTTPVALPAVEAGQDLSVTGIVIADVDAANGQLVVTVSASNGLLRLDSAGMSVTGGDAAAGSASLTLSGSLAELNSALETLTYRGDERFSGIDTIAISVDDRGNTGEGGNLSDSAEIVVEVTPVGLFLQEGNNFSVLAAETFTIPATPTVLQFSYAAFFDTSDTFDINDAFEVALLDAAGNSLVHTVGTGQDAFFNLTEGLPSAQAAGVSVNGETVTLDLSDIPAGTEARLVFRLVNNDDDTETTVRIQGIELLAGEDNGILSATLMPALVVASAKVNFSKLEDVSGWLTADYGRTSFNKRTDELTVEVAALNQSAYEVRNSLVMVVDNISNPLVRVLNADGVTPDGWAYFELSHLLGDGVLSGGETSAFRPLVFRNPGGVQFDYAVSFLSAVNEAPVFVSEANQEALVDKPYHYSAKATDADGDTLSYSLVNGPEGLTVDSKTGELLWNPVATDLGTTQVTIQVEDGHGGIDTQAYTLAVKAYVPNRSPLITTTPVVDAEVGQSYTYDVDAKDPDQDEIAYSLIDAPAGMWIEPTTGIIHWQPTTAQLNAKVQVQDSTLPVANNYVVDVYAQVTDPVELTFSPLGTLYVGRDNGGSGGSFSEPVRIHKIGPNASFVQEYGVSATDDPDTVLFDKYGIFSGEVGGVLVGGAHLSWSSARISAILSDESVSTVFGPSATLGNVSSLNVDNSGRLIFTNGNFNQVLVSEGGFPHVLFTGPTSIDSLALDSQDRIYTVSADNVVRLYSSAGELLNNNVFSSSESVGIIVGNGDEIWGDDLYVHNRGTGEFLRLNENGSQTVVGNNFVGIGGMAFGPDGALYLSDFDHDRILRVAPSRESSGLADGEHQVKVAASDGRGGVNVQSYTVKVSPPNNNSAPLIVSAPVTSLSASRGEVALGSKGASIAYWSSQYDFSENLSLTLLSNGVATARENLLSPTKTPWVINGETGFIFAQGDSDQKLVVDLGEARLIDQIGMNFIPYPGDREVWDFIRLSVSLDNETYSPWGSIGEEDGLIEITTSPLFINQPDKLARYIKYEFGASSFDYNRGGSRIYELYANQVDADYFYDVDAIDPENDKIIYNLIDAPTGMSIDANTGFISWNDPSQYGYGASEVPITIQATDEYGNYDTQSFKLQLPPQSSSLGAITGKVWNDLDLDGVADANEPGLAGVKLYLDANQNTIFDEGEFSVQSDSQGNYRFSNLAAGQYVVREVLPENFTFASRPVGGNLVQNGSFEDGPDIDRDFIYQNLTIPDWTINGQVDYMHDSHSAASDGRISLDLTGSPIIGGVSQTVSTVPGQEYELTFDLGTNGGIAAGQQVPMRLTVGDNSTLFFGKAIGQGRVIGYQTYTYKFTATGTTTRLAFDSESPFYARGPVLDNVVLRAVRADFEQVVDLAAGETISGVGFDNVRKATSGTNNQPKFTSAAPDRKLSVSELWRYQTTATDADADPLAYELIAGPKGMFVDAKTGLVSWRPTFQDSVSTTVNGLEFFDQNSGGERLGQYNIILAVRDSKGGTGLQSFRLVVDPSNSAPIITSKAVEQVMVGLPYQYRIRAQDSDGEVVSYRLASAPAGMTIDSSTGVVSWTPTDEQLGGNTATVIAVDDDGAETQQVIAIAVVSSAPNAPTEVTSLPRTNARVGAPYLYQVEATDPNGDPLSYRVVEGPEGLTVDELGLVTWVPGLTQIGSRTVVLEINDGRGSIVQQQFSIAVSNNVVNTAPEIISTPDSFGATVSSLYRYNAKAFDAEGDVVLWQLVDAPVGMSIDVERGTLRWAPSANQIGNHTVTITAIDALGAFTGQSFELTVRGTNLAPLITSIPVTTAATDKAYQYQVRARDADGDALSYQLIQGPTGMSISEQTGVIEWQPTAAQVGTTEVIVAANDARGAGTTQTYRIETQALTPNAAPEIISQPQGYASAGNPYRYQVIAQDPNGDTLAYQLLQGPTGMSIDAATGELSWQPGTDVSGSYTVVVGANDGQLGGAQRFTLQVVAGNDAPVILSAPTLTAMTGETYRYDVRSQDPNGDRLTYALTTAPSGMTIDQFGRIRWTPTTAGSSDVEVLVSDSYGATTTQRYRLNATADEIAPVVNVFPSLFPADVNQPLSVYVQASDNVGVVSRTLIIDGKPVALTNGAYRFTPTATGNFEAIATATDAAGNTTQTRTVLEVRDFSNSGIAPKVALLPLAGQTLTAPTNIFGSVQDDNLVAYTLSLAALGSNNFREIYRGTNTVDSAKLGVLDTSLFQNDTYTLRLTAEDGNGNVVFVDEQVNIGGDLKLGNFTLSFTDMELPVSGIPVTVTRTYDSLNANTTDDFGYGWRLEFRDTDLRTSLGRDEQYETFGIRSKAFDERTKVYITLPGGQRQGFTFAPKRQYISNFFPAIGGGDPSLYKAAFKADAGVTSTLSVRDSSNLTRRADGSFIGLQGSGFNPEDSLFGGVYVLTTKEGIEYEIDAATGDLIKAKDLNGNTVTFEDSGIYSDNGTQITFGRDAQGRITSAIDPAGQAVRYEYDSQGDLVAVTDRNGDTTRLDYNDEFAHYLDEVIDPLGRSGVKSEYDEQGRLRRILDVNGEAVELVYDPENSQQTVKDVLGRPTTYAYDARGNVVTEIDAVGKVTKRAYDANNDVLSKTIITDESGPAGWTTSYTYDAQRNQTSATDALGNTTYYSYGANGRLLSETDALGNTTTYAYDSRGNMLTTTDAEGKVSNFGYSGSGNVLSLKDALGNSSSFGYNLKREITSVTDATGSTARYEYDARGNRTIETKTVTTPNGIEELISRWTYDAENQVQTMTDPEGGVTTYQYDGNGNQTAVIDALGNRTEMRYNERGQLIETIYADETPNDLSDNSRSVDLYDRSGLLRASIDQAGRVTHFVYDAVDRLVEVIHPDEEETLTQLLSAIAPNQTLATVDWTKVIYSDLLPAYLSDNSRAKTEYTKDGRVKASIDERGNRTEYRYDAVGRLTKTIYADETPDTLNDNPTTRVDYDDIGRRIADTDPLGHTTRYQYDNVGRVIKTVFHDGSSTQVNYDALGRRESVTDQAGKVTEYRYDPVGRLTGVKDALGHLSEYRYDEIGRLIEQEDASDNMTRYDYDLVGRRTSVELPLGQRATSTYDAVGNLQTYTDFNGEVTQYDYDAQNRLIFKDYKDDADVRYTYTANGLIETITDGRGVTRYAYDEDSRLLSRTDPNGSTLANGHTIEYTYDEAGNRTAVITPNGSVNYAFDERNCLSTVIDADYNLTAYQYDDANNLTRIAFANGVVETREYDELNRLTALENKLGNTVISGYRYELNASGHRLSVTEASGRQVGYTYDNLYRLTQENINNGARMISYSYDAVGNRLTRNDSVEGVSRYSYDDNDRLLTETLTKAGGAVDTTIYSYDDKGNLTQRVTNGTEVTSYRWNDDNRLVRAELPNGNVAEYAYDDEGIRVSSTINGVRTEYLLDKNQPYAQVLEETTSDALVAYYVHGYDLISQERGQETSFYQVDGLGSTRGLTDELGAVTDSYDYDAFGNLIGSTGQTENSYRYAGEQFDSVQDNYYLRQRFYDQHIGRFSRRDSYSGNILEPFTLHKYAYAHDNPVNGTDPTGLFVTLGEVSSASRLQGQLAAQSYQTAIFTANVVETAKLTVAMTALITAAPVGLYLLEEIVSRDRETRTEYKLYPEDPQQRRRIDGNTQGMNQMRVQLQYRTQHDHGISLIAVPEIGVTKAQVYSGLGSLWLTRGNGGWFPSSQDKNARRAIIEVSQTIKRSGSVSGGREQVASSQWFSDGRQAPRADYRVDVENIRGTNLNG